MTDLVKDDCIVCFERNLSTLLEDGKFNFVQLTCCGVAFCRSCSAKMEKSALETGIEFTCPICRSPIVKTSKEDFDRAKKHANKGRPWALDFIGNCYLFGRGVSQSDTKAFNFFSRAADKGYAMSQYDLSILYIDGKGCEQSDEKAFQYLNLAAAQGLNLAQFSIGKCYYFGRGVEKSREKAFEWFSLSAENGCVEAQNYAGEGYYFGEGVEKDCEKAVHLYTLAANRGEKFAQYNLAFCYVNGEGVKQSVVKAIYWIRQCLKDNKNEEQCVQAKELLEEYLLISSTICSGCGGYKQPKFTLKCSKCLSVYYCNMNCQKNHWKNGHKQECEEP